MRSSVLLLLDSLGFCLSFVIVVAFIPSAQSNHIAFPLKVLESDLHAISKYYIKCDKTLDAYIHWPKSITFRVRLLKEEISNEKYLKVDGKFRHVSRTTWFQYGDLIKFTDSYNGLYFKDSQFYVKTSEAGSLQLIPLNRVMYYEQPAIAKIKPYLSIRYFGLKELAQEASSFYSENKQYIDSVLNKHPSKFLVRVPNQDGHFLEYTYWSKDGVPYIAGGLLRVLTGKQGFNGVKLSKSIIVTRLVFDQSKGAFMMPEDRNVETKDVFGIRITNARFLAEVHDSGVTMFSSYDIYDAPSLPVRDSIRADADLLKILKTVEPRYASRALALWWPKRVLFQVQGVILVKSVNFIGEKDFDVNCPFIVEFEAKGGTFAFGDQKVHKICTDDTRVWVK